MGKILKSSSDNKHTIAKIERILKSEYLTKHVNPDFWDPASNIKANTWHPKSKGPSKRWSPHIDGLVQKRHNSIANTLELCLSCTNPSIFSSMSYCCVSQWKPSDMGSNKNYMLHLEALYSELFLETINIYLHPVSFLNAMMTWIINILSHGRQIHVSYLYK